MWPATGKTGGSTEKTNTTGGILLQECIAGGGTRRCRTDTHRSYGLGKNVKKKVRHQ